MSYSDRTIQCCHSGYDIVTFPCITPNGTHGTYTSYSWVHLQDARRCPPHPYRRTGLLQYSSQTLQLGIHLLPGSQRTNPYGHSQTTFKRIQFTSYVDANLYHDLISGKSANKTLIDQFSKLKPTVETATFESEGVTAKTCVEQSIDLINTFRYLYLSKLPP